MTFLLACHQLHSGIRQQRISFQYVVLSLHFGICEVYRWSLAGETMLLSEVIDRRAGKWIVGKLEEDEHSYTSTDLGGRCRCMLSHADRFDSDD